MSKTGKSYCSHCKMLTYTQVEYHRDSSSTRTVFVCSSCFCAKA